MHEELDKFCPNCKPVFFKNDCRIGIRLNLVCDNYSGCGIDHYVCPKCKRVFQVSYKVDEIIPMNDPVE